MMGSRAFSQWRIDVLGLLDPLDMKIHAHYIIVATKYVTKWVEVKVTQNNDASTIANFLFKNVFTQYVFPIEAMSDRVSHFLNEVIYNLLDKFMVIHKKLSPYHQ